MGRKGLKNKTNLTMVLFCFKQFSKAGSAHHLYEEHKGQHNFSTIVTIEPFSLNLSVPSFQIPSSRLLLVYILSPFSPTFFFWYLPIYFSPLLINFFFKGFINQSPTKKTKTILSTSIGGTLIPGIGNKDNRRANQETKKKKKKARQPKD